MAKRENNSNIDQDNRNQNSDQRSDRSQSTSRESMSSDRSENSVDMDNVRNRQSTSHGSGLGAKSSVSGSDNDGQLGGDR